MQVQQLDTTKSHVVSMSSLNRTIIGLRDGGKGTSFGIVYV